MIYYIIYYLIGVVIATPIMHVIDFYLSTPINKAEDGTLVFMAFIWPIIMVIFLMVWIFWLFTVSGHVIVKYLESKRNESRTDVRRTRTTS